MSIECFNSKCSKHNKIEPFCDEIECVEKMLTFNITNKKWFCDA
jgi:hypothetical protein